MDTILVDAYTGSLNNILANVLVAFWVATLMVCIVGVLLAVCWPRTAETEPETQPGAQASDETPAPDVLTMGALGSPLPAGVAAWLIADTEATWARRQQRQQCEGGNGHE